jgi:GAF domain-containing protein
VEREQLLSRTFVELADNLVVEFDVVDVLTTLARRSVELLAVDAAAILLPDDDERLRVVASSREDHLLIGLFEQLAREGPGLDCFVSGSPQSLQLDGPDHWPDLCRAMASARFTSLHAVPMRLRRQTLGVHAMLANSPTGFEEADLEVGQALADVATISILQARALADARSVSVQLRHALDSRVVIEQAKGVLSERWQTTVDDAFERLRRYARSENLPLSEVAQLVTAGALEPSELQARLSS